MKNEIKMDGRVSPKMLFEKRKQVVNFYKKGMKLKDISEATGLCWKAIRNAIDLYEQQGVKGLMPGRRGRPLGKGRRLTMEQEKQIQKDIGDKRPEQLKMEFALWTREAVRVYIREHFGIEMPIRTVGEYLKRWGFTPQKPVKSPTSRSRRPQNAQSRRAFRSVREQVFSPGQGRARIGQRQRRNG